MFQKKLCYRYNHLGVIPFEYMTGVACSSKFAGSMIEQFTQIALMKSGQMTAYVVRMQRKFCKAITNLFYFTNLLYYTLQYVLFLYVFCKDIYNS